MYNQDPSPEGDDVEGLVAAAHFWVYGSMFIVFIVTSENVKPLRQLSIFSGIRFLQTVWTISIFHQDLNLVGFLYSVSQCHLHHCPVSANKYSVSWQKNPLLSNLR